MSRPKAVDGEFDFEGNLFKIQIVGWGSIIKPFKDNDILSVVVPAAFTTDLLNDEPLSVKGLYFDLIRHVASCFQSKGILATSEDGFLTLDFACRILKSSKSETVLCLRRLIAIGKIKVLTPTTQYKP